MHTSIQQDEIRSAIKQKRWRVQNRDFALAGG